MARAATQREADLMCKFGFRWVRGDFFETVCCDNIVLVIPTDEGVEVHYNSGFPVQKSIARVLNIEIPSGKFASGGDKDLDTAWIFVYYEEIVDVTWDGAESTR